MFSKLPHASQTPVAVAYTPNSILNLSPPPHHPITMKNRSRYSTRTDVGWFNNNHYLAVINLAAETLHTYAFHPQDHSLTLLQTLTNQDGAQLHWPDKMAFQKTDTILPSRTPK